MSPVGHTLTGLAIASVVIPAAWSPRAKLAGFASMAVLASAPDLPLPYWGHTRYLVSHSVFSTAAGCLLLACFAYPLLRLFGVRAKPLVIAGVAAWYSHLLLDTFYSHGNGLMAFWPLTRARVALPIPWFETARADQIFCWHNLRVGAIEAVCYGALLAMAWSYRRRRISPRRGN